MRVTSCSHRSNFLLLPQRAVWKDAPKPLEGLESFNVLLLTPDQLQKKETSELIKVNGETNKAFADRFLTLEANYEELMKRIDDEQKKGDKADKRTLNQFGKVAARMEQLLGNLQSNMAPASERLAGRSREELLAVMDKAQALKLQLMKQRDAGQLDYVMEAMSSSYFGDVIRDVKHVFSSKEGILGRLKDVASRHMGKIKLFAGYVSGQAGGYVSSFRDWVGGEKEEKEGEEPAAKAPAAVAKSESAPKPEVSKAQQKGDIKTTVEKQKKVNNSEEVPKNRELKPEQLYERIKGSTFSVNNGYVEVIPPGTTSRSFGINQNGRIKSYNNSNYEKGYAIAMKDYFTKSNKINLLSSFIKNVKEGYLWNSENNAEDQLYLMKLVLLTAKAIKIENGQDDAFHFLRQNFKKVVTGYQSWFRWNTLKRVVINITNDPKGFQSLVKSLSK